MNQLITKNSRFTTLSCCLIFLLTFFYQSVFSQITNFSYSGSIVNWVVPSHISKVTIDAKGAQGGEEPGFSLGGLGAQMRGDFNVVPGSTIKILVGEHPSSGNGGGGGTFVVDQTSGNPLVVAGGGGGGSSFFGASSIDGDCGQITTFGSAGVSLSGTGGAGGSGGNGGNITGYGQSSGAGGGFFSDGNNGDNGSLGGISWLGGGSGGLIYYSGGFGGGGSSYCSGGCPGGGGGSGGGGGGYSGGGAADWDFGNQWGAGGGGGSINNGANQTNNACFQSGDGFVTITPIYSLNIVQTATIQCFGDLTGALSASVQGGGAPLSYTWQPGSIFTQNITGIGAGVYTVTVKNPAGQILTSTYTITQPPAITSATVVRNADCGFANGSATVTAGGGTPGYTYLWSPSGGVANSASGLAVGNYTCRITDTKGCIKNQPITIIYSPTSTISVVASPTPVCSGKMVTLTAAPGADSYVWTGGVTNGVPFMATASSMYTVTATFTVPGCTSTGTINLIVNTTPTVGLASVNPSTICLGGGAVITPSGSTGYILEPGPIAGVVFTVTPATTKTYSIYAKSAAGCISTNTVYTTITVNPKPTIGFSSITNSVLCTGDLSVITPSGGISYTINPSGITGISFIVNPVTVTTYTVIGLSLFGSPSCTNLAVTTISVAPVINPTAIASTPSICLTRTLTLTAGPVGALYTYTWGPLSAIQGAANSYTAIARPINTGTVTYTVSVSNGLCIETKTVSIDVVKCFPPVASFTSITSNSICTRGCVTFSTTTTGTQPMIYDWVFEGGLPATSTATAPLVCYSSKGTFSVSLKARNVFSRDSLVKLNYVQVADTPAVVKAKSSQTIKVGQLAQISATGASTYKWYPNDGSIACPTCSMTTAQPTLTTKYVVTGYNSAFCSRNDTITITVDFICGDFFVPNVFSPNGDGLNDVVNVHGFCIKEFVFQVFNRWGEKMFETTSKTSSWDGNYRGKPLDTGVYIYRSAGETIDNRHFEVKGNITLLR